MPNYANLLNLHTTFIQWLKVNNLNVNNLAWDINMKMMSQYYPIVVSGGNLNIESDISNYVTKSDVEEDVLIHYHKRLVLI